MPVFAHSVCSVIFILHVVVSWWAQFPVCFWRMSVDTGRENWVTKCLVLRAQIFIFYFFLKFLKVWWDNASLMMPFSRSTRSHISSTFKIFSIFQNSAVMKQGRRGKTLTNTINRHSEKRLRRKAPYSEIANGSDASQLAASIARPSDVLSSEVMFYHQSLSEISCRQLQSLGVWSPRYLKCTIRRFMDLKVVEIILMSLVWESDSVSQPKTCGI